MMRSLGRNRFSTAGVVLAAAGAVAIGCGGGGGGGSTPTTSSTATTSTATTSTASTSTATTSTASTSTATTSTASTSTATTSGDLPGVLPKNVIFYDQYVLDEASGNVNREFRYISPNGTDDSLYVSLPPRFDSFAPNPVKADEFYFSARSTDTARAGIYKNSRISLSGATQIVGPTYQGGVYGMQVSNDGRFLVFNATVNEELPKLYVLNLQTPTAPPVALDQADRFHISPQVNKIVYSKLVGGTGDDLFVADFPSGANAKNLTNNPASDDNYPQFSADGKKIAFSSDRGGTSDYDLYTILVGGTELTQITDTRDEFEFSPTFSPGGSQLAYSLITGTGTVDGLYRKSLDLTATRNEIKRASGINETRWTGSNGKSSVIGTNVGLNGKRKKP